MTEPKEDGLFRRARTYLEEKFFPLHRHEIFTRRDIWDALNLNKWDNATEYKAAIDRVIYYLTETQRQPSLKREGRGFRIVNRDLNIVEWWTGESTPMEINWPKGRDDTTFYFNDNIVVYPKDIIVLAGESNQGKSLANGTPVLASDGWKNIELLKVGDIVYTISGRPTLVKGVYPQGIRPLYRLTFKDNTWIDCDEEHKWEVLLGYARNHKTTGHNNVNKHFGEYVVKTTAELVSYCGLGKIPSTKRPVLPHVEPIIFSTKMVPVDPYILGVLIGDGSFKKWGSIVLSTSDKEILEILAEHSISHSYIGGYDYRIRGLGPRIKSLGLTYKRSYEKFIPNEYLFNDPSCRLSLLQGLLDTDGSITEQGDVEYTTTSKQLADDMVFLVRSLGGRVTFSSRITNYTYKGRLLQGKRSYRLHIKMSICPFRLSRKAKRFFVYSKTNSKILYRIDRINPAPATCIRIDDSRGLFIAKDFIPTHNTALCLNFLADNMETYPVTYFTSSDLGKEKFKDRIRSFDWVNFMRENGKPKFDLVHQDKNYEDTIQPDNINIIDWLLMTDEMWKIADKMLEYKNCLDKGIVILALQKPRGRDTAYGGEWTKMHASVYLSLSYDKTAMHNVLCVEKCKAPGIEDPNYKKFSFYLQGGAKLINITEITS